MFMLKLATKFFPKPAAFEMAHRAGFRCAELWLDAAVLAGWQQVVALARPYPMELVLHFPNRLNLEPASLEQAVRLYQELGCRCMVIHQPMFDKYQAALMQLDPALRLGIENHRLSPEELYEWAERSPGLTLDVEHLWKFTLNDAPLADLLAGVRGLLERFGSKLRHVHMPGYLAGYDEHRPMYCAREMVFPVLSMLAELRFEGLIVSEINVEYQTPNDLQMDVLLHDTWRRNHASGREARAGV